MKYQKMGMELRKKVREMTCTLKVILLKGKQELPLFLSSEVVQPLLKKTRMI